ncbi:alpha-amylase family glycosyl hydrolase [Mangrovicoccus ximenensis]|uniref:alpha-amylase family glycosyl hydrolase n=1 Tax=Mangrovicoccus ximenensis TaxID=1911570 RepID=UPI000D3B68E4|nr:alpha-amylase family glycosyl hydrolase [Mangrovicoccus ximenensis]
MGTTLPVATGQSIDKDWWRGAVIYQIYPRSFQDSNGDGVGDLLGIAERMPHIASLGVDAVWISPFFPSPMKDFGYDVSHYCDVDPLFGTLADFDWLVERAHEQGVKVIIDLVLSHTSDQNPWFVESRSSRTNPMADWYVWADPKPDGTAPNNWMSFFGGSAWQWDPRRCQYFLHNFLASQPDLNMHNPEVQEAILEMARFWLDRGVDGFRLDTINFYFHDQELRNNPPLEPEERNDIFAPAVNPYNYQRHVYDKNRPENLEFLARLRALLDTYPAATLVGEVGEAQGAMELLGEYTKGNDRVHMCYAFEFLSGEFPSADRVADIMDLVDRVASQGWACWAFSNHDVERHVSRWGLDHAASRAYALLLMCLRGSVCIYQGEELGLPEADVPFEALQDPYGIEFWPEYKGRDGCRTPFPWDGKLQNAGFSPVLPWLPVPYEHHGHAVAQQELDPGALLHHYRRVIQLRHDHPALRNGKQSKLHVEGNVVIFEREQNEERLFLAFNLSEEPADLAVPKGEWQALGQDVNGAIPLDGWLHLGPWQPCILSAV